MKNLEQGGFTLAPGRVALANISYLLLSNSCQNHAQDQPRIVEE